MRILNYYLVISPYRYPMKIICWCCCHLISLSKHPQWWNQAVAERCANVFNLLCKKERKKENESLFGIGAYRFFCSCDDQHGGDQNNTTNRSTLGIFWIISMDPVARPWSSKKHPIIEVSPWLFSFLCKANWIHYHIFLWLLASTSDFKIVSMDHVARPWSSEKHPIIEVNFYVEIKIISMDHVARLWSSHGYSDYQHGSSSCVTTIRLTVAGGWCWFVVR